VHLSGLTLRGFKSFADKTRLDFEPGVTVVVGPNGSGKSNIVDALTWVLGSHSAKSMRGGSMSDVIFAGSSSRSALGRAAVEITIDNSSGVLPIDYTEVTFSRAMFASGENDYAINGEPCRLLDVAELLSDSGLGRENHTIVGQGRIDAVLNAKPEERRAFVEEAAGILKHRRRKERSLRKLAQTEAHLERLTDVLREVERNLKPLARQAEAARKHADLAAELRGVRVARALRELDGLTRRRDDEDAGRRASQERLSALEQELRQAREQEARVEAEIARLAPDAETASRTHFRLANLVERYEGLRARIEERRNGLAEAVEEPVAGRDPEQLRDEASEERVRLTGTDGEVDEAREALRAAEERRAEAERARRAHEQAAAAEARRRAQERERRLRWEGEVAALRSGLAQAASEQGRLASQLSGIRSRRDGLAADVDAVQAEIQRLDAQVPALSERLTAAESLVERRAGAAAEAARAERELERRRASLEARADALRAASQEATGGAADLLEAVEAGEVDGVRGPLADLLRVTDDMAKAVAGALGPLGDALVADSRDEAAAAVGFVRETDSGRVLLLACAERVPDRDRQRDDVLSAERARPLVEALRGDERVVAALAFVLADVYVVPDYPAAARLSNRYPSCVFVTREGELAGPTGFAGGSAGPSSAVTSRAGAERAEAELEEVAGALLVAHRKVGDADRELATARQELDGATAAMQESDGAITGAAERLGRLRRELAACEKELARYERQASELEEDIAGRRDRLRELESRGNDLESGDEDDEPGPDLEAERLDDVLARAREQEVEARLAASTAQQTRDELARRIAALEREADEVEAQLAERERRREARMAGIVRCGQLAAVTQDALDRAVLSARAAAEERDRIEKDRAERQGELGVVRAQARDVEARLTEVRDVRHREDLARQQLDTAIAGVRGRLADDLGIDPDEALSGARSDDSGTLAGGEERDAELTETEERLARKIGLMGTVNPLAVKEHAELEERHRFLTEQVDDLTTSRKDLQQVVDAVDDRIRAVFAEAFRDVAQAFTEIFPRLFPGGHGRLVLTDPDNLLETGVEVEARPPGKKVKRLSLLSGGERSLTALAVLFAIFRARPSPFYVLDEVEAALDDINLQRFLGVVQDFKQTSQLIVVTHQKRTMEIADVLYGVSMQRGGVSKVISQRMGEAGAGEAS
jgi:chromosome segregation protein